MSPQYHMSYWAEKEKKSVYFLHPLSFHFYMDLLQNRTQSLKFSKSSTQSSLSLCRKRLREAAAWSRRKAQRAVVCPQVERNGNEITEK